ncbi:hypothetical protein ACOME3_001876 [Neoechinorhynchus agilis]
MRMAITIDTIFLFHILTTTILINTRQHSASSPIQLTASVYVDKVAYTNLMIDRHGHILLSNCNSGYQELQGCEVISLVLLKCDPLINLSELIHIKRDEVSIGEPVETVKVKFTSRKLDDVSIGEVDDYEYHIVLEPRETHLMIREPCIDPECLTNTTSLRCNSGWIDFSDRNGRRLQSLDSRTVSISRNFDIGWTVDRIVWLGGEHQSRKINDSSAICGPSRSRRQTVDKGIMREYEKSFDGDITVNYIYSSPIFSLRHKKLLKFDKNFIETDYDYSSAGDTEVSDELSRKSTKCDYNDNGVERCLSSLENDADHEASLLSIFDSNDNVRIVDYSDTMEQSEGEICNDIYCPEGVCQPTRLHRECDLQYDPRFGNVGNNCILKYSCMPKNRMISCSSGERCSRFAVCTKLTETEFYCVCRDGFVGDGDT